MPTILYIVFLFSSISDNGRQCGFHSVVSLLQINETAVRKATIYQLSTINYQFLIFIFFIFNLKSYGKNS